MNDVPPKKWDAKPVLLLSPRKRSVNGLKLVGIINNYSKNRMEVSFEFS
jgi:hypothetical protein